MATTEFKREFIVNYMNSGMTKEGFCRVYGYSPRTLNRWKEELGIFPVGSKVRITASDCDLRGYDCNSIVQTGRVFTIESVNMEKIGIRSGEVMYELVGFNGSAPYVVHDFVELAKTPQEGDFIKVIAEGSKLRELGCHKDIEEGVVLKVIDYDGLDDTVSLDVPTSPWILKEYGEVLDYFEAKPYQATSEESGDNTAEDFLPAGTKVRITAEDDELRNFLCHEDIVKGSIHTIEDVDKRDYTTGAYELADCGLRGWVLKEMVEEFVEEPTYKVLNKKPEVGDTVRVITDEAGISEAICSEKVVPNGIYKVSTVHVNRWSEIAKLDVEGVDNTYLSFKELEVVEEV